jgi:hypothetical protein
MFFNAAYGRKKDAWCSLFLNNGVVQAHPDELYLAPFSNVFAVEQVDGIFESLLALFRAVLKEFLGRD